LALSVMFVLPLRHSTPRRHILKHQFRARMHVGWIPEGIRRDHKSFAAQFFLVPAVRLSEFAIRSVISESSRWSRRMID
jgi:hypothetical protein